MRAVTIYSTSACNLRCKHCGVGQDQLDPRPQLDTEEMKQVISRLAEAGTRHATILGGEATIFRNDLAAILDHATQVDIAITINTNLTHYASVEPLLNRPALRGLIVSLDGARPETHDAVRGSGTFTTTVENIRRATLHPRARTGDLTVEIAFVLTALNHTDSGAMVALTHELGARALSVKSVKAVGRAETFAQQLTMTPRDLLDAYSEIVVTVLLVGSVELDMFLPPATAKYLNERFDTDFPVDDHPACGGADTFGYVDLHGNHMPCPAMSYEENPTAGFNDRRTEINLLANDALAVRATRLFTDFEHDRSQRTGLDRMYPCPECRYKTMCSPCTADHILGRETGQVDICAAVFAHADEELPGFTDTLRRSQGEVL